MTHFNPTNSPISLLTDSINTFRQQTLLTKWIYYQCYYNPLTTQCMVL